MTSLRFRLVIGFMLVSVPAMMASAYIAARLISDAYEENVEQWLGETSRFFALEIAEATLEAQRVAGVIGHRLEQASDEHKMQRTVEREFAVLSSVGYDLIAIYRPGGDVLFKTRDFSSLTPLPAETSLGLFRIETDGKPWIMAGAVQAVQIGGQPANILVGTWLDESSFGGIKVVTSLEIRLFALFNGQLEPVMQTHPDRATAVPDSVRAKLEAGEEAVFESGADGGTYRAVYSGLRGIDGQLAAISFIGMRSEAGFFEQLGRESLFLGIFLLGSAISIVVGILTSDLLVRPLRALTHGVRAIAAGDFGQRVSAGGGREIVELVYLGQSQPWQFGPRPEHPWYHEKAARQLTEHDPAKANAMLDKIGLSKKDGSGMRLRSDGQKVFIAVDVITANPHQIDSLELVKRHWAAIGIDMKVNVIERALYYTRGDNNDHDAAVWGGPGGLDPMLDPRDFFAQHPQGTRYAIPWANWYVSGGKSGQEPPDHQKKRMQLFAEASGTTDLKKRGALMKEVLDIAADQFEMIGLCLAVNADGVARNALKNVPKKVPNSWSFGSPGTAGTQLMYFG